MINKFNIKKIISSALALSMFANVGAVPGSGYSVSARSNSLPQISESGFRRFVNDHPFLTVGGITALGAAVIGIVSVPIAKLANKVSIPEIKTAIDNMTDEQVAKYREEKIKEFKEFGGGVYEVDQSFVELPLRVSALIIGAMISVMKAYPNIFSAHIDDLKREGNKFCIAADRLNKEVTLASTSYYNMTFNKKHYSSSLKHVLHNEYFQVKSKFHSPVDSTRLVECTVTHEIGHLIQKILMHNVSKYKGMRDKFYGVLGDKAYDKVRLAMKEEIIDIARQKFNYKGDGFISEYGSSDPGEFFAEVNANYFCSEEPNELGLALGEILDAAEKSLSHFARTPKSNSGI